MKMLYTVTVSLVVFLLIIRLKANEIHHSSEQHILYCVYAILANLFSGSYSANVA